MKRVLFVAWLFHVAFLPVSAQPIKHVILISIDGLRPDFYLDKSWKAPNLQKLKTEGVYARGVRSVFPSVTYPSHTTMITGAYPARHGVYYNVPYGEKGGHWYWEESYIQTPTLWDAVKEAGLTSAAVMWPVTVGAPIDYNFPVRRADNDEKTDQLSVTLPYITPKGLIEEIQQKATGKLSPKNFSSDSTIDKTIGKMGAYIFKTYKPNLMALHFISLDHMQHEHGREGVPIKNSLALIDSMVGVVMKAVGDAGLQNNTAVLITGDHGFVNSNRSFSPNVLLAQHGLLSETKWSARFHSAGGAAFLYLHDNKDTVTLEKVKQILRELPSNQQIAFRLVERAELDKMGVNPEVALGLAMSKGFAADNKITGEVVKKKKNGGSHGYFPDFDEIHTGFLAAGAGIRKKQEIKEMGIKDIAPLISGLLGLSFNAPDGVLVPGILTK
jgi:predicted AlkP superfamily pyrophosphatase or phosphodiesterase